MRYEPIPITPALVSWARKRSGVSVSDAKTKFPNIESWESGEVFPSYPQLENLAETYKVPVAVFFFPEPPDLPSISETFRTLPDEEYEKLPRNMLLLLRKAKAYQISLQELSGGANLSERNILKEIHKDNFQSIAQAASDVREFLGVTIEDQMSWKNAEVALKNYRELLIDAGVYVFKDAFKNNSFCGFCLYDEQNPIIYVNNSSTKTRQLFTLFHELAHLVFETSGIDKSSDDYLEFIPENDRRIEILCNRFAAEILVPDSVFDKAISRLSSDEETAVALAGKFNVSRELIYRKFLDRELISKSEYTNKANKWAKQKSKGSQSGSYYNNVISYLGKPYLNLAFREFYRERINATQLADYLNVSQKSIETLEVAYQKGNR